MERRRYSLLWSTTGFGVCQVRCRLAPDFFLILCWGRCRIRKSRQRKVKQPYPDVIYCCYLTLV